MNAITAIARATGYSLRNLRSRDRREGIVLARHFFLAKLAEIYPQREVERISRYDRCMIHYAKKRLEAISERKTGGWELSTLRYYKAKYEAIRGQGTDISEYELFRLRYCEGEQIKISVTELFEKYKLTPK